MGFECKLAQGETFIKIIDCLKELTQECNFDLTEDGIACQCMDTSHVALVSLKMNADGFDEYSCKDDMSIGLNLANLGKILKCSGGKDSLAITAKDSENITFAFTNEADDRNSTFQMKLYDIDAEQLGIPETEYNCSIKMPSGEFAKICRDLMLLGDSVKIRAEKSGVAFTTKGDIGSGELLYKAGKSESEKGVQVTISESVTQCFALRYLRNFSKSAVLSSHVTLSLSDDIPLTVAYDIEGIGHIKYFLAPKVEDDD